MITQRTAVYRLFNEDADLLYVGKSLHPPQRWREHAASKPWWGDVRNKTVEWFDSDDEAAQAETTAIQDEKPRYNVLGTPLHRAVSGGRRPPPGSAMLSQADAVLAGLRAIADPVERFAAATATIELARDTLMPEASSLRQEAVQELRDQDLSLADISKLLGVDRSRLHQISTGITGGKRKPAPKDGEASS